MKKSFKIYFTPDFLFGVLLFLFSLFTVLGAALGRLWPLFVALPFAAFSVYRVLSRDLAARAMENRIAKKVILYVPIRVKALYLRLFPKSRYAFAECPACSARLRYKRMKEGTFYLTCPRCKTRFPLRIK